MEGSNIVHYSVTVVIAPTYTYRLDSKQYINVCTCTNDHVNT